MTQNNIMRLTNYHSHTTRCMHAAGTEEEYVLQAIKSGFECLARRELMLANYILSGQKPVTNRKFMS
jgi:histidinol phosphatase-like PHP family hydrolase